MIKIDRLSFGYGKKGLFQDLQLNLQPGNIYGLLGLNGAGKSSLLKLMTGLLFPQSGELLSLGYEPTRREPEFLSRVFFLPEEMNVPNVTIQEYVKIRAPFYPNFDHNAFNRYIGEFELPAGHKLIALSHGQKKKLLLSFGLTCNSSLLVLDEPTNGLDIPSKGQFRRLVAEAVTDKRIFVISTHQVRDVESLIDSIVVLHKGRVLFNHAMSDINARIRMSHVASKPDDNTSDLLYCEPAVGGFWTVWKDTCAEDGLIDLEVLFDTVISHPDIYTSLFNLAEASA